MQLFIEEKEEDGIMRIGFMGQKALLLKNQTIFAKLGHQICYPKRPEELAQLDGLWLSTCQTKEWVEWQTWRQMLQNQPQLAVMGAVLGAVALAQNGPLALMDYQANYIETAHHTAELLRIPSWNDHRLTAIFGPKIRFDQIAPNLGVICQTADRGPIILRQGNLLAVSFIPEETADQSIYHYFLEMARKSKVKAKKDKKRT